MKNLRTVAVAFLAACTISVAPAFAGNVTWGASQDNGVANSAGVALAPGNLVLIGAFNITDDEIRANATDINYLSSHFATFGTSSIGSNVEGAPGYWFQLSSNNYTTTTPFAVAGLRIFIWTFDSMSMSSATEHGIFSHSTSTEWLFPQETDNPNSRVVDLTDLTDGAGTSLVSGANILYGGFNQGTQNPNNVAPLFNTAPIPEPSTYMLIVAGAAVFFVRRRIVSRQ